MTWRLAKSLEVLRDQVNQMVPARSKASDGTIAGGEHHKANPNSDHEPWVTDGGTGVVTAMDITNDPAHGLSSQTLAETLAASRDPRIKYIISNRRICNSTPVTKGGKKYAAWDWSPYNGKNPHDHHVHVSVKSDKAHYDSRDPWTIGEVKVDPTARPAPARTLLKRGMSGPVVEQLQELLGIEADGDFGPGTEKAVKALQKKAGIVADGVVGTYTWAAIENSRSKA